MWKIGPEWAAQHAKWVSAIAQNWGARTTSRVVYSRRAAAAPPSATTPISAGAFLIRSATGITMSQARSPSTSIAPRQPQAFVSPRASGAMTKVPRPMPAETTPRARPRREVNHRLAVAERGA